MPRQSRRPGPLRPVLILATTLASPAGLLAQTRFWSESFDNGCTQGCPGDGFTGANGAWTVTDVTPPGSAANQWFVSCAENGEPTGQCGRGCGGDATLHVGNVSTSPAAFIFCPTGDCGAAYDATNASIVADKRAVSPRIDASAHAGLQVKITYLGRGQPCNDGADVEVSLDDGLTWSTLMACLTSVNSGCSGQGRWTDLTLDLPQAASHNPDLRLAFHWRNNGDGRGNDPSFAVNDVELLEACSGIAAAPADLGNVLRGIKRPADGHFDWSMAGAPAPPATHFHVYRAEAKDSAYPGAWTLIAGDAPALVVTNHDDSSLRDGITHYYRVSAADDCGLVGP